MTTGHRGRQQFQALFSESIPFVKDDWNMGAVADGNEVVVEQTVTGAALGDFVLVGSSADLADLTLTAAVTAADTVTIQLGNWTGGSIDHGTVDIYGVVLKRGPLWDNLT
jgi:hypothetical protein